MNKKLLGLLSLPSSAMLLASCGTKEYSQVFYSHPSVSDSSSQKKQEDNNDQPDWGGQQPNQGGNNDPWQQPGGNQPDQGGGGQPDGRPGGNNEVENNVNFTEYGTLPVIKVTTENNASIDSLEDYTTCSISLDNCDEEYKIGTKSAGIRLRGNSTSSFIKKPYRIKFDKKQPMLGLNNGNSFKSWVLLAEFNDYSYIHNYYTYHLASKLNGIDFVTDSRYVEVYINDSYKGIYLLTEQVQVNGNRVDIDESGIDDETITDTGFLLEMESVDSRRAEEGAEGEAWFRVDGYAQSNHAERAWDSSVAFYVIKSDARSTTQVQFIKDYMEDVYDAIYQTKTEEAVSDLIDVDSAVDMYLIQLLANDYDNNYSSVYVWKDAGGKLEFGAPWDFDLAYGTFNGQTGTNTEYVYHLLNDLGKLSWFKERASQRYDLMKGEDGLIATTLEEALDEIDSHKSDFDDREYVKWRRSGYNVFGPSYNSQDDALDYFETWLNQRVSWMDDLFE